VKSKREYIIPFIGLKLGFHEFEFEIRDAFFEDRDYSIIHSGSVNVKLILEKKETMLIAEFEINGVVSTSCDRCNDPVDVPVKGQFRLVFKFGLEESDDETLIVMHPDTYEIDIRENIYELITVSLPSRCVHKIEECNQEMLELLSKYSVNREEEEGDDDEWEDEDWDEDDEWDDDEWDDDDDEPSKPIIDIHKNLN